MTDINKSDDSAELAAVIASSLDRIFGTRDFGPASQDVKLADTIIAAGYTKQDLTDAVLTEISQERERQNAKWGEQNHPDGTGPQSTPVAEIVRGPAHAIVNRHYAFGLASNAKEATDEHAAAGTVTFADILLEEVFEALAEDEPAKLRTELVQVAAVATQWVEAIDRRTEAAL